MANNTTTLPAPLIPAQASVLDFFVPGSTSILAAVELVLGTNSYIRPLMLCMFLAFLGRRVFRYVRGVAETYFVSTVHVQYGSEVYDMVSLWTSSQPFAHRARSSMARVGWRRPSYSQLENDRRQNETRKKLLYYLPWNGTFYFSYNKHLFWFCSKDSYGYLQEVVTVSCFGSPTVLRQFFDDCRDAYLKLTNNKTAVFEHQRINSWQRTSLKSIRPISTVVMDEENKEGLLRDIESFLDPGAITWHANRGILYRRGYLLYGPPGTGKSSLCLSLAVESALD
ncbi:BCS1 N terminal-domain-containing protein, partial [Chaetomium tenue]